MPAVETLLLIRTPRSVATGCLWSQPRVERMQDVVQARATTQNQKCAAVVLLRKRETRRIMYAAAQQLLTVSTRFVVMVKCHRRIMVLIRNVVVM
ncbi:hypothetical protein DPMN_129987 [Dreissena polymorpha]|uniref:Uncharacterized protein n=1 Tax=Dreissena polymorpha TaxID=45954 RepID=A0A9D4H3R7_DREPO|nr:hypothetical protein DPMN_129987 [Dreissena polymorpha]